MKDLLAGFIVVMLLSAFFSSERFGAVMHERFNLIKTGWESVK